MRKKISSVLQGQLEENFGRKIMTSKDCQELSESIFLEVGEKIHPNTLRRFFGLVKAAHLPSKFTLEVFARYCGYQNLQELPEDVAESNDVNVSAADLLHLLTDLFATNASSSDDSFLQQTSLIVRFLSSHPSLANKFHKEIAKTVNGQKYYFEQFIQFDRLNSSFGDGLNYYLKEKKTKEAQIFGHSLLAFRYWLTMDNEMFKRHYKDLTRYEPDHTIHPFVSGRYFATCLFHYHIKERKATEILEKAQEFYKNVRPPADKYADFPCFELTFSEGLALTGYHAEALTYLDEVGPLESDDEIICNDLVQQINLIRAYCLSHVGAKKEAQQLLETTPPSNYYFISRKYKTLLYLLTTRNISKNYNSKIDQQIEHLIEKRVISGSKNFMIAGVLCLLGNCLNLASDIPSLFTCMCG